MGHAYEMAKASNVTIKLNMDKVPYIKEAREYALMGLVPEGSYNNRNYLEGQYEFQNLETWQEDILFDPQTSGGLLITCTKENSIALLEELNKLEMKSALVGEAVEYSGKYIIVS